MADSKGFISADMVGSLVAGLVYLGADKFYFGFAGGMVQIFALSVLADYASAIATTFFSGYISGSAASAQAYNKYAPTLFSGAIYVFLNKFLMWDSAPQLQQFLVQSGSSFASDMIAPKVSGLLL